MFIPWEQGAKSGGGLLNQPKRAGILDSLFNTANKEKFLNFLQSPEALGLATGLLDASQPSFTQSPSFSGGLSSGLKNVLSIQQEKAKQGGLQGKFGKALSDYNAIVEAYGPEHEYTRLAKQNLDNISAGSQGLSFEFDPSTGAYTLGMGGTGNKGGRNAGPSLSGEGSDAKVRTPPTPATTTDVQKQIIAKKRAEIVNPYLEHPYVGSGANKKLANDILKYRKNPTPELKEKLIKLATADKLVSYGANLNLLAEGGSTGESATKRQEAAVQQGWAEGSKLAIRNLPKDIIEEAKRRADQVKDKISRASEKEYASGFAIDLPGTENDTAVVEDEVIIEPAFRTDKEAEDYLVAQGASPEKIREVAKKRNKTIAEIAHEYLLEHPE